MPLSIEGLWAVAKLQAQLSLWLNPIARPVGSPFAQSWIWAEPSTSTTMALSTDDTSLQPTISVVIPALNEARQLPAVLDTIHAANSTEVIVVDGGSADGTAEAAEAKGARVVNANPGRSHQLNCGAAVATGPLLLFLHADTRLPEGFDYAIRQTLAQPGVVAGAFRLAIDGPGRGLRWVEWGVNLRSCLLQMPYGDQGIFLKAEVFHSLGGFPDLPMMEDFELVRRLRKMGRVALAPSTVVTSDRRWRTLGIWRTTLANQIMIVGYVLGINPQKLARWYRDQGKPR